MTETTQPAFDVEAVRASVGELIQRLAAANDSCNHLTVQLDDEQAAHAATKAKAAADLDENGRDLRNDVATMRQERDVQKGVAAKLAETCKEQAGRLALHEGEPEHAETAARRALQAAHEDDRLEAEIQARRAARGAKP